MSGLLRNAIAFVLALFARETRSPGDVITSTFLVTPFDTGLRVLKSDRYLQLAETAQVDYLLRVGRFFPLLRQGIAFVNLAQQVTFAQPVRVFSRVRVETHLLYTDARCAWFSHRLTVRGTAAAEVLVKMKFKQGRRTVPPAEILPVRFDGVPAQVQRWSAALDAS